MLFSDSPITPPSPAEREQRADSGGGVVGVREAEPKPDKISRHVFHVHLGYALFPKILDTFIISIVFKPATVPRNDNLHEMLAAFAVFRGH